MAGVSGGMQTRLSSGHSLFFVPQNSSKTDGLRVLSLCDILRRSEADSKDPHLKHAVPDCGILGSR
jgi:hypothetical protein